MSFTGWTAQSDDDRPAWLRDDGVLVEPYRARFGLRWQARKDGALLLNKIGRRRTWSEARTAKQALDDERACAGTGLEPRRWYLQRQGRIIDGPFLRAAEARANLVAGAEALTGADAAGRGLQWEDPEILAPELELLELQPDPKELAFQELQERARAALVPPPVPGPMKAQERAGAGSRRPQPPRPGQLRDQVWAWIEAPANKGATLGDLAAAFGVTVTEAIAIRDGRPMSHGRG